MDNLTGQSLKGYELLERLGNGGFGAVYRAYQSTIGREVAVKVILPHFANRPDFIRRFEAEAQLIARLEHLHIVPLYDYWREPDGAYLVMRWLRGGSAKDALKEGPFGLESAALLLDQVASALNVAHAAGVIHRDLKPSNILLDEEGNAYLADFGIAVDLHQKAGKYASGDSIAGTPHYLAPEQARDEPLTPQTDIYSLGATLYELLAGAHPFRGLNAVELLYKQINEPLPKLTALPEDVRAEVNAVIQQATAKDPRQRYADALSLAAAFRRAARLKERAAEEAAELLTSREQEVLALIAEGLTNRQIAQQLYVEHSTVKWYIRQIYNKLDVRGRKQAIARAREMQLGETQASVTETETTAGISVALPVLANPYKGLRAFAPADRNDFFGREALLAQLLQRLQLPPPSRSQSAPPGTGRFLAVVGPSGSGKSSLIRAGLIPALWDGQLPGSQRWYVVELAPGARPLDELEVALIRVAADQAGNLHEQLLRDANGLLRAAELILPRDDSELVLVIDQFEELFDLAEEETGRAFFLELLATAVTAPRSRVRVVLTLRADYYDRPLHYPEFGQLLRGHMETVMPLKAEELERAIARPAEALGVGYEPGLVSAIIDDVLYQPGALPPAAIRPDRVI
jgi:DNA-binding CsgD family transcriptional regulator